MGMQNISSKNCYFSHMKTSLFCKKRRLKINLLFVLNLFCFFLRLYRRSGVRQRPVSFSGGSPVRSNVCLRPQVELAGLYFLCRFARRVRGSSETLTWIIRLRLIGIWRIRPRHCFKLCFAAMPLVVCGTSVSPMLMHSPYFLIRGTESMASG